MSFEKLAETAHELEIHIAAVTEVLERFGQTRVPRKLKKRRKKQSNSFRRDLERLAAYSVLSGNTYRINRAIVRKIMKERR